MVLTKRLLVAMMNKVKCRFCGEVIDREVAYQDKQRKGWFFCNEEHFIESMNKVAKNPVNSQNPPKPPSNQAYFELVDYIYNLYDKQIPAFVFKQIKDLTTRKQRPFTNKGIELSLRYWVDTLENPFDKDMGIGIVEYVYDDAERFWKDKQRIKRASENMEPDKVIAQGRRCGNIDALRYKLRK